MSSTVLPQTPSTCRLTWISLRSLALEADSLSGFDVDVCMRCASVGASESSLDPHIIELYWIPLFDGSHCFMSTCNCLQISVTSSEI
jgi:hypothetical protein